MLEIQCVIEFLLILAKNTETAMSDKSGKMCIHCIHTFVATVCSSKSTARVNKCKTSPAISQNITKNQRSHPKNFLTAIGNPIDFKRYHFHIDFSQ